MDLKEHSWEGMDWIYTQQIKMHSETVKWILKNLVGRAWTGVIWQRIGTSGRLL
jgi:hypothetical protein